MSSPGRWDIFCQVIDNFGDIGVCWRLARQLAAEHGIIVRLWVDDLDTLRHLCPDVDLHAGAQHCAGVDIRHWATPFPDPVPAEVVIEAFGCELPLSYQDAMAQSVKPPVWINLEYLTAESWVEGCHALPSPHPHLPLTKHFFFPGFTPKTGGLLREQGLLTARDASQRTPAQLWRALKLPCPAQDEITVSLFCYDTAPVPRLLAAWQNSYTPVRCLLPESGILDRVATHFGLPALLPGTTVQRGNLTLQVLPFLRQEEYDLLLWACDCNFVRGEDSFIRAQWAGKPMVWQIYAQAENAHLAKLDAFLERYCSGLDQSAADAVRAFHHGWNGHAPLHWNDFLQHHAALLLHARTWAEQLARQPDLASNLVIFCKNRL
ncbi:hypothetical protein GALL_337440 [mine drainage metagenome]|uniref:Elongation factor P maturation arginine rhamnosyltransferase EarP n=1 Tax=mine drainage metagenome TaxID=410659 RepID=A0A1J5QM74_9ZZZZ